MWPTLARSRDRARCGPSVWGFQFAFYESFVDDHFCRDIGEFASPPGFYCFLIGSKLRCIRSTPTKILSMRGNDFECFASTGVNTPPRPRRRTTLKLSRDSHDAGQKSGCGRSQMISSNAVSGQLPCGRQSGTNVVISTFLDHLCKATTLKPVWHHWRSTPKRAIPLQLSVWGNGDGSP
jgi:hypothetical protein